MQCSIQSPTFSLRSNQQSIQQPKQHSHKRRGFTLVEMVASAIILAIITISVTALSVTVADYRTKARNTVFLSTHNLNVMEQVRQLAYDRGEYGGLYAFYDEDAGFSTNDIKTRVYVIAERLDPYTVYEITIDSRLIGYVQELSNTYILTNIGTPSPDAPR